MPLKFNALDEKGFTLVEVMIAFTIFIIGMLAITRLQLASIQGGNFSSTVNGATTLAGNIIERAQMAGYANVMVGDNQKIGVIAQTDYEHVNEYGQAVAADVFGYAATWTVVADNSKEPNKKIVTVTVTWKDLTTQTLNLTGEVYDNS